MKKLLLTLCMIALTNQAYSVTKSYWGVNRSSNTTGVATTVRIENSNLGDILHSVIVGDCPTGEDLFTLYDSSGQASNTLAVIDTSTAPVTGSTTDGMDCRGQYVFNVLVSSGITYTKTGSSNLSILWSDENSGDD